MEEVFVSLFLWLFIFHLVSEETASAPPTAPALLPGCGCGCGGPGVALEVPDEVGGRHLGEGVVHHAFDDDLHLALQLRLDGVDDQAAVVADPAVDVFGQVGQLAVEEVVHADSRAGDVEVDVRVADGQPLSAVRIVDDNDLRGSFADGAFQIGHEIAGSFHGHDDDVAVDVVVAGDVHVRHQEADPESAGVDVGVDEAGLEVGQTPDNHLKSFRLGVKRAFVEITRFFMDFHSRWKIEL